MPANRNLMTRLIESLGATLIDPLPSAARKRHTVSSNLLKSLDREIHRASGKHQPNQRRGRLRNTLVTVWLQVQVLPGPPAPSAALGAGPDPTGLLAQDAVQPGVAQLEMRDEPVPDSALKTRGIVDIVADIVGIHDVA